ncbi:MAG: GntR family transcriptional regulator [Verrucomicrobiae bacterium]|nr:GntR family transcriptional regulator [Verrucomicrobiae bacterium]
MQIEQTLSVHEQIERYFERLVRSGGLKEGEPLPSSRTLARQWGVDYRTVQKSLRHLRVSGVLAGQPRGKTFVRGKADQSAIGILLGYRLTDETAYFHRKLVECIHREIDGDKEHSLACMDYDGLGGLKTPDDFQNSLGYRRFSRDLQSLSFHGIIQILRRSGC